MPDLDELTETEIQEKLQSGQLVFVENNSRYQPICQAMDPENKQQIIRIVRQDIEWQLAEKYAYYQEEKATEGKKKRVFLVDITGEMQRLEDRKQAQTFESLKNGNVDDKVYTPSKIIKTFENTSDMRNYING